MWWILILLIIVILLILLVVSVLISKQSNSHKYDWINLPFYQKMRHLGRNPPDYAHRLADKYTVKDIVKEKCPKINIAKLIYVSDSCQLPRLDTILEPNKSYLLKANNGSARNKKINIHSNIDKLNQKMERWLSIPYHTYQTDEKFYGQIHPKVLIEEMIDNIAYEYRIYCFHGTPHYIRAKKCDKISLTYYTPDWKKTDISHMYTPSLGCIPKPKYLEKLISCAKQLSKNIAFVCVDIMATTGGKLYFGEFTFTPHNSSRILVPDRYQEVFSNLWKYRD